MPSKLRVIEVPATAGNVATTVASPPDGHKYRLVAFKFDLVTDATVANRIMWVALFATGGSNSVMPRLASGNIPASQTKYFGAGPFAPPYSGTAWETGMSYHASLPGDLVWSSECTLGIGVDAGVAGDSYTGRLLLEDIAP